jgi:hypothetical protein
VSDPELEASLDALSHSIDSVRMEFFNIYDLWGRALMDVADLRADGQPPHIVVIGCTPLGRAVAVAAGRQWRSIRGTADERVRVTLLDPSAGTNAARLLSRYPALARSAEIVAVEQDVSSGNPVDFAALVAPATATAVFLCLTDDGDNLALALDARSQLGADVAVVIPGTAWAGAFTALLPPHSGILAVGYAEDVDALDLLATSGREELAREVHDHYRTSADPSSAADVSWAALGEDLREANRAQVDGLERGLRALWFRIAPVFDWDAPTVELTDPQFEALAELEHERWCRERRAAGWRFGRPRDDAARRHPDLVAWADLPTASRDKDRGAVRDWPAILARAGRRLVPDEQRERLARQIHVRHRAARLAAGESSPPEWESLDESTRTQNRESADEIALKLLRVGCSLAPAWDNAPTASLSSDEIEALAELEHQRWCRSKVAHGWRLGTQRDDANKVHPDLVDWEDLPDDRREVDREHVRAIPELLQGVGLKAVRDAPESPRPGPRWARRRWGHARAVQPSPRRSQRIAQPIRTARRSDTPYSLAYATAISPARPALATIRSRFTSRVRPPERSCRNASTNGVTCWPVTPSSWAAATACSINGSTSRLSSGGRPTRSVLPPSRQCASATRAASPADSTRAETGGPPCAA